MKRIIVYYICVCLHYIFRIFPIQKNKIYIQNFNGKGYGDNPKYIAEEIIRQGLHYKLVWAVAPEFSENFPQPIKTVPYKSIRAIYDAVTAKIWIDNCRKQPYVRKRKRQYYIQTWHGTVNLKKVEKDVEGQLSAYYVKQAKHDSTLANLFLSDSQFTSQLYRSAFWYNGEILECGSPRGDILINRNSGIDTKVKNHFNIAPDTKIILYAPTFRDNFNVDVYNLNCELILNTIGTNTKEPWVFLVRLHPNIAEKSECLRYNDRILNATHYNDMQELLRASTMLITDYSDCMYEFSLMRKPVFLYIKDHEEYMKERGFYFDLFSLPFPCAVNNDELLQKILHFDTELYQESLEIFFRKVGIIENGNASKRVVGKIMAEIKLMENK